MLALKITCRRPYHILFCLRDSSLWIPSTTSVLNSWRSKRQRCLFLSRRSGLQIDSITSEPATPWKFSWNMFLCNRSTLDRNEFARRSACQLARSYTRCVTSNPIKKKKKIRKFQWHWVEVARVFFFFFSLDRLSIKAVHRRFNRVWALTDFDTVDGDPRQV